MEISAREKIASLNDSFRATFQGGIIDMRLGLQTVEFIAEVKRRIQSFTDFTDEFDLEGERDFGIFELDGQRVIWRINYYNENRNGASTDPANPEITTRVMEVILGDKD